MDALPLDALLLLCLVLVLPLFCLVLLLTWRATREYAWPSQGMPEQNIAVCVRKAARGDALLPLCLVLLLLCFALLLPLFCPVLALTRATRPMAAGVHVQGTREDAQPP